MDKCQISLAVRGEPRLNEVGLSYIFLVTTPVGTVIVYPYAMEFLFDRAAGVQTVLIHLRKDQIEGLADYPWMLRIWPGFPSEVKNVEVQIRP